MTQEPGALAKKPDKKSLTLTWRGIVLILVAVLLLVFAVQNLQTASINFLGATVDVWVWLIVVVTFGLFVRHWLRLRQPLADPRGGCGCAGSGEGKGASIIVCGKKGERPQVRVRSN